MLKAPVTKGRYHLSRHKIVPSSRLLKRSHEYMLIEGNVIMVLKTTATSRDQLRADPPEATKDDVDHANHADAGRTPLPLSGLRLREARA